MENQHEGRLTVYEFLRLAQGIVALVKGTSLNAEDQAKVDQAFSKLKGNDPAVAGALADNQPATDK